jgi:hypothetical protein
VRPPLPEAQEPPDAAAAAVADLHRQLIGVRRRHPWLATATIEEPEVLSNEVLGFRLTSGADALGVVLNVGDAPADVVLPLSGAEVVAGSGRVEARGASTAVSVPPHDFAVLSTAG